MSKISSRKKTTKAARPPERASAIQTPISKRVSRDGYRSVDAIATRIRSARRRNQISLDVLASRVGLDKGYVSRIERDRRCLCSDPIEPGRRSEYSCCASVRRHDAARCNHSYPAARSREDPVRYWQAGIRDRLVRTQTVG